MKKGQGERQSYSNRVEVVLGKWQVTVQSLSLYKVEWNVNYEINRLRVYVSQILILNQLLYQYF